MCKPASSLYELTRQFKFATLHIVNDFDTIEAFHSHLDDVDLLNEDRMRPSWDTYFMVGVVSFSLYQRKPEFSLDACIFGIDAIQLHEAARRSYSRSRQTCSIHRV